MEKTLILGKIEGKRPAEDVMVRYAQPMGVGLSEVLCGVSLGYTDHRPHHWLPEPRQTQQGL